jgi:hypothetical protein
VDLYQAWVDSQRFARASIAGSKVTHPTFSVHPSKRQRSRSAPVHYGLSICVDMDVNGSHWYEDLEERMTEGWPKSISGSLDKNSRDVDLYDQFVPGGNGQERAE